MNVTLTGGPLTPTGATLPTAVRFGVLDEDGSPVRFDRHYVQSVGGELTDLLIAAESRTVTIYLAEGRAFNFTARGLDQDGNLVAFGTSERLTTGGSSNATSLELITLLGDATLVPRLPTTSVLPGQELDLLLSATPPLRADLVVPVTHYSAAYSLSNGNLLRSSQHGVRIRVGDRASGDLVVTATATGAVAHEAGAAEGAIQAVASFLFPTDMASDIERPSISDLAFDPERSIFTGVADDDFSLELVELYDGPVLLATTDSSSISDTVSEIRFPGGGTAFLTYLIDHPGATVVTLFATDHSGNESRLALDLRAP